ncbi:iron-regulated protein A [Vibrio galatheae]|uniref:Iron-regulated protein A n=1 Tax=Vibrio galatheae TaxID=579748 RepID=A0A0F4NPY5_9VIBR|nr:imelysin family protein [Vibrio galatheae]KJY84908.1 iron-regulated protein A [Vibrio galatheae]
MKHKSIALGAAIAMTMIGCQTTQTGAVEPQNTSHVSQSVYEVEFLSAQAFKHQSTQLSQAMSAYCASTTELEALKGQWHQTMLAWMALQGQERGPEQALAQSWNIQFWPDKKNTTGRKMGGLVKQKHALTQSEIAMQSVTVQGLGAIEWLLFDTTSNLAPSSTTCITAQAITANIELNAAKIAEAWSENPWTALDQKQWQSEYIALLSNQLEYSMKKMSRPLAAFGKPRPYFAESWRSETSMQNLKANIEAMQTLYFANGLGIDAALREKGKVALADSIANQFAMTIETWPNNESLFDLLQTKKGYQNVYAQYNKLEQLKYLIHEEVAIELGVVIGFNATDGD